MSTIRGGPSGGRARGRGSGNISGRGASSSRGRLPNGGASRGASTPGTMFGQAGRGNATSINRGIARTNGFTKQTPKANPHSIAQARGSWQERYDKLEKDRKRERAHAIAEGSIADPDKPRTLSEAITPVGRCMDMCAEFERVQRVVQNDVWKEETDANDNSYLSSDRKPEEARFVKKFRRAAAGIDEQLPSDLRPPHVLKQTCDFLFDEIVANAQDLGSVHHFVWDRTRAIRNDFTILQVSTPQDLAFAVECFERIVRFHILSLHQMAVEEKPYHTYDWQQDREQLDRTLLSLMQFYDDSRGKIELTNEPEFRAYLVVFQLQDPIPDLEDRVQNWPIDVIKHPRVRKALTLYSAACNTLDIQGPLKPGAPHVVAQQDWQRFWNLVGSTRTSYLMACTAEIYFNLIRRTALQGLLRSTNQRSTGDSTIDEVCDMLFLDSEEEVEVFCNRYNISFIDGPDGQRVIDLSALKNRHNLPEPSPAPPKQTKSSVVEDKRFGRTFPAIINGLSVKEAQNAGMIDGSYMMEDEAMEESAAASQLDGTNGENASFPNDSQSLFLPDDNKAQTNQTPSWPATQTSIFDTQKPATPLFGQAGGHQPNKPFTFGTASSATFDTTPPTNGFFGAGKDALDTQPEKPKFNFLSAAGSAQSTMPKPSPPPGPAANGFMGFGKPASPPVEQQSAPSAFNFTSPAATNKAAKPAPTSGFGDFNFTSQAPASNGTTAVNASPVFGQTPKASEAPAFTFGTQKYMAPQLEDNVDPPPSSAALTAPQAPSSSKETSPTNGGFSFSNSSGRAAASNLFAPASNLFAPSSFGAPASKSSPSPPPSPANQTETTSLHSQKLDFSQQPSPKASLPKAANSSTSRKASASDLFNKPAKPSPLAQSFTFGGNPEPQEEAPVEVPPKPQQTLPSFGGTAATTPAVFPKSTSVSQTVQPPTKELFPAKRTTKKESKPAEHETKSAQAEPDFTYIVSDLPNYITLEPFSGLLDQYIDFVAGKVITDVQETLYFERVNVEADAFRNTVLSHRYGILWRDICRRKRLARQGRERRRRNRQRLLDSHNQASETASLTGGESFFGGSEMGSARGSIVDEQSRRQEMVDKQFQQSVGGGRWSRMAKEEQARGGNKRPGSSLGAGSPAGPTMPGHKRFKSTSHVDGNGRVTKPLPTSSSTTAAFARSSFLGILPGQAPLRNSTKTNYFKLKAMGQPAISDSANARARKRQRSEVSASPAGSPTSIALFTPSSAAASPPAPVMALQRRSSSTSVKALKTREDDDALFARLRAARENLKESATFFQTEVSKVDELRKSTSSYESPSLDRARIEARWRASQSAGQGATGSDVPAYRLRESRFVPRENYGKALERSREFRASRSDYTSRPESRTEARANFKSPAVPETQESQSLPATTFDKPTSQPSFGFFAPINVPPEEQPSNVELHQPFGSQLHQPPAAPRGSNSFTPFGQSSHLFNGFPAEPEMSSFQPNPEVGGSLSTAHHGNNLEPHDHTILPSQIEESLANSFGQNPAPDHVQASYQTQFAQTSEVQQDSYLYTQDETPGQGNSDHEIQLTSVGTSRANGHSGDAASIQSQLETFVEDKSQHEDFYLGLDHANPFGALAHSPEDEEGEDDSEAENLRPDHISDNPDEDEEQAQEEEETQWEEEEAPRDDSSRGGRYPAPPHYTGQYDDDFDDGDDEDEDSDGLDDVEGYDDTEDATEEDDDPNQLFDPAMVQTQGQLKVSPPANPAFSGGGSQGDAIELSD